MIGVLGGMGPAATWDFCQKLTAATPVYVDQGHIPVLVDCDPRVPDRSGGESPLPAMVVKAQRLKDAGATLLVIPCNTAAAWNFDIERHVGLEVVDWVGVAAASVAQARTAVTLLATQGTWRSGIWPNALINLRVDVHMPDQEKVDEAIAAVKRGQAASARLILSSMEVTAPPLFACTELSMIAGFGTADDPARAVARHLVMRHLTGQL
jgi:aspartate racemase